MEQMEYKRGIKQRPWRTTARNKQLPPDDKDHRLPWTHPDTGESYKCEDPRCLAGQVDNEWSTWLFMAGRGTGKTFLGANWLLEQALAHDGTYWALCGPTYGDVRSVLIEGKTGLLKQALDGDIPKDGYNRNNQEIKLRNGSTIIGCSAEKIDSPRGHNFSGAWLDELCQFEKPEFFHEGLMPALREGDAKLLITTTPRRTRLLRELLKNAENPEYHIHVTRGATRENPYYSKRRLAELEMKYKGTHLYKQELLGELIEDLQGSLFNLDMINAARIKPEDVPQNLTRIWSPLTRRWAAAIARMNPGSSSPLRTTSSMPIFLPIGAGKAPRRK
jgi:phage terminase large subunit-like protein